MGIRVEGIHHVCLAVADRALAEAFYMGVLGLGRHHKVPAWLVLNDRCALHLFPLPAGSAEWSRRHEVQHFALQVPDLRAVLTLLLGHAITPFQADFAGQTRTVTAPDDPLDFGTGTLFARDPDGNLVEFLQLGRGLFTDDVRPRATVRQEDR